MLIFQAFLETSKSNNVLKSVRIVFRRVNYGYKESFKDTESLKYQRINDSINSTGHLLNWFPNHYPTAGSRPFGIESRTVDPVESRSEEPIEPYINQTVLQRPLGFDFVQGLQEGIMAEIISVALDDTNYEYTTIDAFHLTLKSLILDILTNLFTIIYPMVNAKERIGGNGSNVSEEESEYLIKRRMIKLGVVVLRCFIIPLLFHGIAHTVPTVAMHFIIENMEEIISGF